MSRIAGARPIQLDQVKIIVAQAAGSAPDILARLLGQWLSERLGQQFVTENRPGGGNTIGTEVVVRAPPDGYTLLLVDGTGAINATLYEKLNYNFIRDIATVAGIVRLPTAGCARSRWRPPLAGRGCQTSRPWASSSQATRRA